MSPRRFLHEMLIMSGVVGGTCIGYSAGMRLEPTVQTILAFLGMALGGAFVDLCLRGGRP